MPLIAVDGSKLILPESDSIREEYGVMNTGNKKGATGCYSDARCSVAYDLLNQIVIDAQLDTHKIDERTLAIRHLDVLEANDLLLFDRGYPSFAFFTELTRRNLEFVCRTPQNQFVETREFTQSNLQSQVIELAGQKLRLVKVELDFGEIEILITSLCDEQKYPTKTFKELYFKRWGVETYYDRIKSRLELENFTGKSPESVKQDFHSTIYLSNLESLLTYDVNLELAQKQNKHRQQVNKAVAFHAIKSKAFDLILSKQPFDEIYSQLLILFRLTPNLNRKGRNKKLRKTPLRAAFNYHKRKKKRAV